MKPRTFARRPSSMASNQLSKSRSSASPGRADVVTLVMAWSPLRRSNAGISRVEHPGDYATLNSNHPRDGTQREIVEALRVSRANVSALVEALQRVGHVAIASDP